MKKLLIASFVAAIPFTSALAQDPVAPVNDIVSLAEKIWAGNGNSDDYFSKERLENDFSADFVKAYKIMKKRAGDEVGGLDYDIVTGAQDGCPLKDVKIEVTGKAIPPKSEQVFVSFKPFTCFNNDPHKNDTSKITFLVIKEKGSWKIDDIKGVDVATPYSVKADMLKTD